MSSIARFFKGSGSMPPDAKSYIERSADTEIYRALRQEPSEFCYVLTSRQMGKSSLIARTEFKLRAHGVRTAVCSLAVGGEKTTTAPQWYHTLAEKVAKHLEFPDFDHYWSSLERYGYAERLLHLFEQIVRQHEDPIVLFFDEIDATLSLDFTDDFFAALRECYNRRDRESYWTRLAIVLCGVASPTDLIKDSSRTPFNVGRRIDLDDFSVAEARHLFRPFAQDEATKDAALERLLYWTGGHPYLTHKICYEAALEGQTLTAAHVESLIERCFLEKAEYGDDNLTWIRLRLRHAAQRQEILRLYRRVRRHRLVSDIEQSPSHTELKLIGIVVARRGQLCPRNRIYETVFDLVWIRANLPTNWSARATMTGIVITILAIAGYGYQALIAAPSTYAAELRSYGVEVPAIVARQKHDQLARIWWRGAEGDRLLAEYWDRRSVLAEANDNVDEALLLRLEALRVDDTPRRRREAGRITAALDGLNRTMRFGGGAVVGMDEHRVVSKDGSGCRVWDLESGRPLSRVLRPPASVADEWRTGDGPSLVWLTGNRVVAHRHIVSSEVYVWDLARDTDIPTVVSFDTPSSNDPRFGRKFLSHDGSHLAVLDMKGVTILEPAETRRPPHRLSIPHPAEVSWSEDDSALTVLRFDDGEVLRYDGEIQTWPMREQKFEHVALRGQPDFVRFEAHDRYIVRGTVLSGIVTSFTAWEAATGKAVIREMLLPNRGGLEIEYATMNPSATRIVVTNGAQTSVLDVPGGTLIRPRILGFERFPILLPDDQLVMANLSNAKPPTRDAVEFWSTSDRKPPLVEGIRYDPRRVETVRLAEGGQYVILEQTSDVFDVVDRKGAVAQLGIPPWQPENQMIIGGNCVVVAEKKRSTTWDFTTGVHHAVDDSPGLSPLGCNQDGSTTIFVSDPPAPVVHVWRATSRTFVGQFGIASVPSGAAVSADGETLALVETTSTTSTVSLWTATGTRRFVLSPALLASPVLRFSLDGKRLAVLDANLRAQEMNAMVYVWNTETGELAGKIKLPQLSWFRDSTGRFAITADGSKVLVADSSRVTLWNVETGMPFASRSIDGGFDGGIHLLRPDGLAVELAVRKGPGIFRLETYRFDDADAEPVPGKPEELIRTWGDRVALHLKEDGNVEPVIGR